jgi:uncharacterized membrane protein YjjP (DUF1212 family)
MSLQERSNLILNFAKVLFANGQATDLTISATKRLGRGLGLHANIIPRWGELGLQTEDADAELISQIAADPSGVDMDRVASTMRAVDDVASGRSSAEAASKAIAAIANAPPAPTWLFALAAAAGAVALAVIFGVEHIPAAVLIFISAGAGALLRRALGRLSENLFLQPFCAALLAGVIGAIAVRYDLSSSLRLVAVCPCMVLVPGPHFLNSALDLIAGRIHLGSARLIYAGLIVVAIAVGLLLGLAVLGVSLPTDPAGRAVPLWQDVIAAGVAVAAYIFFSTPLRAALAGRRRHVRSRFALVRRDRLGFGVATGALVTCVVVALILTLSRAARMPFAAIGFASVVSMMPGVYLFRMGSGLVKIAAGTQSTTDLVNTVASGATAAMIILAMSFGLIIPKLTIDYFSDRASEATS